MKSIIVIQEVQILPRVTASHRPGSETRWQDERNVRSRVEQVGRPCIEPRNGVYVVVQNTRLRTGKGINIRRTPESRGCEPRTVSTCWNATSQTTPLASRLGGHRGRRPGHADQGMTRELARASLSPVIRNRGSLTEPPRESTASSKLPTGKASTARSILSLKRRERRYDATSRMAKARRMDARQS